MNTSDNESGLPNYYAIRYSLSEISQLFLAMMPNYNCVDIGETIRLMLADFFYADEVSTQSQCIDMFERRLVVLPNQYPPMEDQQEMMEILGDIFWNMADNITRDVLTIHDDVNGAGTCRPNEAFYSYDESSLDLMVYIPATSAYRLNHLTPLDCRAVWTATRKWWPTILMAQLPKVDIDPNSAY